MVKFITMMLSFLMGLYVFFNITATPAVGINNIHAIYVSVLEIEQFEGENVGNISIKVFANDLEDAIFNKSQKRINLQTGECDNNKALVNDYFAAHLQISIDGNKLEYNYLSCEINDISIWFSYSFTTESNWSELEVRADYLMELFPTQSNVVSVTKGEEKRMFRLTNDHTTYVVSLNK